MQLIPEVARQAAELTVYQRTPIWVVPKIDVPIPNAVQKLFSRIPLTQRIARAVSSSILEMIMVSAVLHYKQVKLLNKGAAAASRAFLRSQVSDASLRKQLTPDYDFGCKRPTFSNSYFRTFTKDNVHLETTPIDHIAADGNRHRRRSQDRDRHLGAGNGIQPLGCEFSSHRGYRSRGTKPR